MSTATTYRVSDRLLDRDDFKRACADRDFKTVFALMRKWDGASQNRIAAPVEGLHQTRVSAVNNGNDRIKGIEVIERIADGLGIPGTYFGLAPRPWETGTGLAIPTATPHRPPAGVAVPTGPPAPARSMVVDDVIDNHMNVDIDVAPNGAVTLTYRHELHNMTALPFTKLARQFWFKHVTGPLVIEALPCDERDVLVQRVHDVGVHVKFACQFIPAIRPGETAHVAYRCAGGRFLDELYWRQSVYRPTKKLCLSMLLHDVPVLTACSAVEEHPEGSEVSATESLVLRRSEGGTVIDITRHNLRPNQSVTLRWDTPRATT